MTLALQITMTQAGQARFTAAQLGETIDLAISSIGLTDAEFILAPTLTALPGEFRRIDTISGKAVGDHIVHLTMRDEEPIGYTARGFGLFLADDTLFAVYGQSDRLFEKSLLTTFLASIDIAFPTAAIDNLTFGNTDFLNPPATTTQAGVVELATLTEARAGTDTRRVVPVSVLVALLNALEGRVGVSLSEATDVLNETIAGAATKAADNTQALSAFITRGEGLVTGSGRNNEDRILTVIAATGDDVRLGQSGDSAVTPEALAEAGAVYVVEHLYDLNGYRQWSDGLKECWGAVNVPANSTARVDLPIPHEAWCVPAGSSSIAQDGQRCGALNATATGFDVRNRNSLPTVFFWQTKGR